MIARAVGAKKPPQKKANGDIVLTEADLKPFEFEWHLDDSKYSGLVKQYVLMGQKCYHIVHGDRFAGTALQNDLSIAAALILFLVRVLLCSFHHYHYSDCGH